MDPRLRTHGQAEASAMCYPLRDSAILFTFRTNTTKLLLEAMSEPRERRAGITNECEWPMRGVSRERADGRFTTGVAPRVATSNKKRQMIEFASYIIIYL